MVFALEILCLLFLIDVARRLYRARDSFFHAQAFAAWELFVGVLVVMFAIDIVIVVEHKDTLLVTLRHGLKLAGVTSLWVATVLSLPGLVRTGLEKTRKPLHPNGLSSHSPNGGDRP